MVAVESRQAVHLIAQSVAILLFAVLGFLLASPFSPSDILFVLESGLSSFQGLNALISELPSIVLPVLYIVNATVLFHIARFFTSLPLAASLLFLVHPLSLEVYHLPFTASLLTANASALLALLLTLRNWEHFGVRAAIAVSAACCFAIILSPSFILLPVFLVGLIVLRVSELSGQIRRLPRRSVALLYLGLLALGSATIAIGISHIDSEMIQRLLQLPSILIATALATPALETASLSSAVSSPLVFFWFLALIVIAFRFDPRSGILLAGASLLAAGGSLIGEGHSIFREWQLLGALSILLILLTRALEQLSSKAPWTDYLTPAAICLLMVLSLNSFVTRRNTSVIEIHQLEASSLAPIAISDSLAEKRFIQTLYRAGYSEKARMRLQSSPPGK